MFVSFADLTIVSSKSNLIDKMWKWNTLVSTSYPSVVSVFLSVICEIMTTSQSRSLKYNLYTCPSVISYWAGTVHMPFTLYLLHDYKAQIMIYI